MKCSVLGVKYENPDTMYRVVSYKPEEEKRKKNGELLESFTGFGIGIPNMPGCTYEVQGSWVNDPKYGFQLKIQTFQEILPTTCEGIENYLKSGVIKYIGERTAKSIVAAFGTDTFRILDEEPQRLKEIKGINEKRLQELILSYRNTRGAQQVISYLARFGISAAKALKIQQYYGENTIKVLQENPYQLMEMSGFGFSTVDKMAVARGIAFNAPIRIHAGVLATLQKAQESGYLYLDSAELIEKASNLLENTLTGETVTDLQISEALKELTLDKKAVLDGNAIYLTPAYEAECSVAKHLKRLCKGKCAKSKDIGKQLEEAETTLEIKLSEEQKRAVQTSLSSPVSIITGGPGTGKTTIQKVVLHLCSEMGIPQDDILLCAPTGRAARRMAEATAHSADTIHMRLMHKDTDYLSAKVIIVDEASMIDEFLARDLLQAVQTDTRLIFIGDINQLDAVGPGRFLSEMINSDLIPTTRLKEIFRQENGSKIIENAAKISNGNHTLSYDEDFQMIDATSENAAQIVKDVYLQELAGKSPDEVQILTPLRKRGSTGVQQLNPELQELVNPPVPQKAEMKYGTRIFRTGDKVMQIKNTDNAANGDIGNIQAITYDPERDERILTIDFGSGRICKYGHDELENLDLAYASTIHKSQGSEYDTVIIPILTEQSFFLRRNLIYTAVTRAKAKVILIGSAQALHRAIAKMETEKRNTKQAMRLRMLLGASEAA